MALKDFGEFVHELFERYGERTPLNVLEKACGIFLEKGECSEEELCDQLETGKKELERGLAFLRENYLVKTRLESITPTAIGIMVNSNIQNLQKVYEEHCNPPKVDPTRQAFATDIPMGAREFIITLDGLIDDGQGFMDKQSQLKRTIETFLSYLRKSGGEDYELIEKDAEEVMKSFTEISNYLNQITENYAKISDRIRI